jgi:serine/threonine protein phosphatase 1
LNILVVGDVHGCLHAFQSLIEKYWTGTDLLIQLGDLIDRGNFSGETIHYVQTLQEQHPGQVIILRGNHEQEFIEYVEKGSNLNWLRQRGHQTLESFLRIRLSLSDTACWMKNLPLFWENEHIFVSHAGVSNSSMTPFDVDHPTGILWNRQSIRNLGKIQIFGHTPTLNNRPKQDIQSNSWNIDTGACFGGCLSAIKLTQEGNIVDFCSVNVPAMDLMKNY